jgi:hypothetical protein
VVAAAAGVAKALLDLNAAPPDALMGLRKIGRKRAKRIVAHRPFVRGEGPQARAAQARLQGGQAPAHGLSRTTRATAAYAIACLSGVNGSFRLFATAS